MKTLIKNILVAVVLLGTSNSYANEVLNSVPTFNKVNKGDQISVTDAFGEVIYSGLVNYNGNLTNLFDFSQLKDGTYTIEINKDFEIEITSVMVKNHIVTYVSDADQKIYKPVFRTEDSTVIISKIALDSSDMKVEFYYDNELIYSEMVNDRSDILNRVYKLDENLPGEYTAVIESNGRVYIENFRI